MTVEELKIILKVNGASTYTHTVNEVTNVTNSYKNSIGNLTSAIAKLVSAGMLIKFSRQCVQAASDLQEVANVTDVTFGQSADVVNKWAKNQAANFGLSETAAKRYIGTYGTMAKQFGMTTDQAATMGVELAKLTGDVASFYNLTDSAASVKLKAIFTGETESLKELGVVMTETQLNSYAMSKGIGKTVKDMTEQEKVLLRYQFTLEKLSHAQGDFARTSDGFANSARTLSLNLENLKVELGNELIPVAVQGISAINAGIQAVRPILHSAAETVRLYAQAWQEASATTKTFVGLAVTTFAVLAAAPKVIALVRTAVKMLTVDTMTLAATTVVGIAGILLALSAAKALSEQVENIRAREAANELDSLGQSSEISAGAVDELAGSIDNLNNSSKGLETFLASFDEVNQVGGNNSLMSGIVNTDDLANILAAANGLNDINGILNTLDMNADTLATSDIFSLDFWKEKAQNVINEIKTIGTVGMSIVGSFFPSIRLLSGVVSAVLDSIKKKMTETFEKITEKYNEIKAIVSIGITTGKAVISSKTGGNSEGGSFLGGAMKILSKLPKYGAGGEPRKGTLFIAGETGPELVGNFGGSQTKVLNQSQMPGGSSPAQIMFSPTIMIDGKKITAVVMDYANNMMRSGNSSPIITLGG